MMKEYFIVPVKKMKQMESNCKDGSENDVLKNKVLNSEKIAPEIALNLIESLKYLQPKKVNKDEVKIQKSMEPRDIENQIISFLPNEFRESGRDLYKIISELPDINIDSIGSVSVKNIDGKIRVEDLLKAFLFKNSAVKPIKTFIETVVDRIPTHLIKNKRVEKIKQNINEKEIFYDSIGGGMKNTGNYIRKIKNKTFKSEQGKYKKYGWKHFYL